MLSNPNTLWWVDLYLHFVTVMSIFIQVQERALKVVPDLCDSIDYAEVQGVLFPRVAVRPILFV